MQNLLSVLVSENLISVTSNGIEVPNNALVILKLTNEINGIVSKMPALASKLTENVYEIKNGLLFFNDKMIDLIDNAFTFSQSAQASFWSSKADTALDKLFDNSTWDYYLSERRKDLYSLKKRAGDLSYEMSQASDRSTIASLASELRMLNMKIATLEGNIVSIANDPTVSRMVVFAQDDFRSIEQMLNGELDPLQVEEVEDLLLFYMKLFSVEDNLVFTGPDFRNPDGTLTENGEKLYDNVLSHIKTKAEKLLSMVESKKKDRAMAIIANNPSFSAYFKDDKPSFDSLMYITDGLPDSSMFDQWLMDSTNGIFSHNGMIPQVMNLEMQQALGKAYKHVLQLQEDLKKVVGPAEKALGKLNGVIPGIGKAEWNIFLNHSKSGLRQDGIISAYTYEYQDKLSKAKRRYEYNIALSQKILETQKRIDASMEAIEEYIKDLNRISEMVTYELIPELRAKNVVKRGSYSDAEAQKYKDDLISRMGQYTYDKIVKEAERKALAYQQAYKEFEESVLAGEGVSSVSNLSAYGLKALDDFTEQNIGSGAYSGEYTTRIPKVTYKNGNPTEFYNEVFKKIEGNKALMDFYKILEKNQNIIYNMLPPDKQNQLGEMSLLSMEKTFWELYSDKNMTFFGKMSVLFKHIWEYILNQFSERVSHKNPTEIDSITGKPILKVNDSWMNMNSSQISALSDSTILKIMGYANPLDNIREAKMNMAKPTKEVIAQLSNLLGVMPTQQAVEAKLGFSIGEKSLYNTIRAAAMDRIMSEQSIDLPKMLLVQLHQATAYNARMNMMPRLNILKNYYEQIKTENGGLRVNAMKQMDSWFKRIVLDEHDNNLDLDKIGSSKSKAIRLTKADKARDEELEVLQQALEQNIGNAKDEDAEKYLERMLERTKEERNRLGRKFSISSVMNGVLNMVRFVSLGYNLNSNVTNFAEGQLSNAINADRGYYTSESLNRANKILWGSTVSTVTLGKVNMGSTKLVKHLMEKFDVQMDASNELQKSTRETGIDKLSKLGPWELTKRTEYLNQSPLLVAILLEKEVKGINGQVSNAWDALDPETYELRPEFKTPENIALLEDFSSNEFYALKSKISKTIMDVHGDYSNSHGNMASEYFGGKALLNFKRWMIKKIYTLIGVEQFDLELGKDTKGVFRSLTSAQLSMFFGMGGLLLSPFWAVIGGTIGLGVGLAYGLNTSLGLAHDYLAVIKNVGYQMLRIPMLLGTKHMENKLYDYGDDVREIDKGNMKSAMYMMAMTMYMLAAGLIFKAMTKFGDDDEEDGVTIYLANKAMQIANQSMSWINPLGFYQNLFSEMGLLKYVQNTGKFLTSLHDYLLSDGEGQKVVDNFRKIGTPSLMRSYFGFGPSAEKDFYKTYYDKLMVDDEDILKNDIKIAKETELDKLRGNMNDISEEDWTKLKRKVGAKYRKKPNESPEEHRARLERKGLLLED